MTPESVREAVDAPPLATPSPPASLTIGSELRHLGVLVRMRLRTLRNHLEHVRTDSLTRTLVVVFGLLNVVVLGVTVSYKAFAFIEKFEAFGIALNTKIIALLFFALLVLVVLSTVIITYTTAFIARETAFFHELPLRPRTILWIKLAEAIGFSSWASLFLGFPVLVSYGALRDAPASYYLQAAALLLVFIAFAGLAGATLAFAIAPVVRRLSGRQLLLVGFGLFAGLSWLFLRSFAIAGVDGSNQLLILDRFTSNLSFIHSAYSPSQWAAAGIHASLAGNHSAFAVQGGTLLANTLIFLPLAAWYGARHYGKHWLAARTSSPLGSASREGPRRAPAAAAASPTRTARFVRRGLGSARVGALMTKDVLVFVRDPAQISQSLLFLLLMAIYSLSLSRVPQAIRAADGMQTVLYFANLAAICTILSSFTSRFLFPLISLEGKAFWIVGLAPVPRSYLVYQKAALGLVLGLVLGIPMTVLSTLSLHLPVGLLASALFVVTLSIACLTALATCLGAAYPNFDEDNPARIAVGLGGTLNFFASALTVALLLGIEGVPYLVGDGHPDQGELLMAHAAAGAVTIILCRTLFRIGKRAMERSEF